MTQFKRVMRLTATDNTGAEYAYQADPHESMAGVLERFSDKIQDGIRVGDIASLTVAFDEIPARTVDVGLWKREQQLRSNLRETLRPKPIRGGDLTEQIRRNSPHIDPEIFAKPLDAGYDLITKPGIACSVRKLSDFGVVDLAPRHGEDVVPRMVDVFDAVNPAKGPLLPDGTFNSRESVFVIRTIQTGEPQSVFIQTDHGWRERADDELLVPYQRCMQYPSRWLHLLIERMHKDPQFSTMVCSRLMSIWVAKLAAHTDDVIKTAWSPDVVRAMFEFIERYVERSNIKGFTPLLTESNPEDAVLYRFCPDDLEVFGEMSDQPLRIALHKASLDPRFKPFFEDSLLCVRYSSMPYESHEEWQADATRLYTDMVAFSKTLD